MYVDTATLISYAKHISWDRFDTGIVNVFLHGLGARLDLMRLVVVYTDQKQF